VICVICLPGCINLISTWIADFKFVVEANVTSYNLIDLYGLFLKELTSGVGEPVR
jgi:hypothetical protein